MKTVQVFVRTPTGSVLSDNQHRVKDSRWGDDAAEASLQVKQFSAWNEGAGGNSIPLRIKEGDTAYERIGRIVDEVAAGNIPDPTGGATHYYSPQGMRQLVRDGHQTNEIPSWLPQTSRERDGENVTIGRHIFSGLARTGE